MRNRAPIAEEAFRLERKSLFEALEREPEERFDRLTRLARRLLKLPAAMLVMTDGNRPWFKSVEAETDGHLAEILAYCECAQKSKKILQLSNTQSDMRTAMSPVTSTRPGYSFFASVPLYCGNERTVGLMCVADKYPRVLDADEQSLLTELGRLAELEILVTDQAQTDLLTGIPNRRGFESQACRMIRQARKDGRRVAAVFLDIDGMSSMNRLLGRAAGDRALRFFGSMLRTVVEGDAVLGRLGGDEFVLLALDVDQEACEEIVDRLRARIADARSPESPACDLRFSFGIAVDDPLTPRLTLDDLMHAANSALHRSRFDLRERCFPFSLARRNRAQVMLVDSSSAQSVAVR